MVQIPQAFLFEVPGCKVVEVAAGPDVVAGSLHTYHPGEAYRPEGVGHQAASSCLKDAEGCTGYYQGACIGWDDQLLDWRIVRWFGESTMNCSRYLWKCEVAMTKYSVEQTLTDLDQA